VVMLPIRGGGIMHAKEIVQKLFVTQASGIELHLDCLRVAGATCADVLITWIRGDAAGITNRGLDNARNFANNLFHTPKAAPSENRGLMDWRLDQACLCERLQVLAITGLIHFFDGYELKRSRIDTVAQTTFISRSVIKHVAEMRVRQFRPHLRPARTECRI